MNESTGAWEPPWAGDCRVFARMTQGRRVLFAISMAGATMAWQFSDAVGAARCMWSLGYPPAIGPHTVLLATATAVSVTAPLDTPYVLYGLPAVPAQVMAINDVAGHQSEAIRRGLRASGGTAAFVRYGVSPGCTPYPARDGRFDSVGVNGVYMGSPRSEERWIGGRPTFDVFGKVPYPLPQGLSGARDPRDSAPTMTAAELFTMYGAFWAESVTVGDTSAGRRIKRWLDAHPAAARKNPANDVAERVMVAIVDAQIAANPIPLGGTFAITVVVPGLDSVVIYGRTWARARPMSADMIRDSATGLPVGIIPRSFMVDMTMSTSLEALSDSRLRTNACPGTILVVDSLPIVLDTDATWRAELWLGSFLKCAPPGSALAGLTGPGASPAFDPGQAQATFRRLPDGRVILEARATQEGSRGMLVRGERISTLTSGPP